MARCLTKTSSPHSVFLKCLIKLRVQVAKPKNLQSHWIIWKVRHPEDENMAVLLSWELTFWRYVVLTAQWQKQGSILFRPQRLHFSSNQFQFRPDHFILEQRAQFRPGRVQFTQDQVKFSVDHNCGSNVILCIFSNGGLKNMQHSCYRPLIFSSFFKFSYKFWRRCHICLWTSGDPLCGLGPQVWKQCNLFLLFDMSSFLYGTGSCFDQSPGMPFQWSYFCFKEWGGMVE